MAYVDLVPFGLSITARKNTKQNFASPVIKDAAGAAVDMSTWNTMSVRLIPTTQAPTNAEVDTGIVPTGTALGVVTIPVGADTFDNNNSGNANYVCVGKKEVGDEFQLIGSGTFILLP